VSIAVDGQETAFEVCDAGAGWVGVGEVPEPIITIDRRVCRYPPSGLPDSPTRGTPRHPLTWATRPGRRSDRSINSSIGFPLRPVRRYTPTTRDIEAEHARKLASRTQLTAAQGDALQRYWLERLECHLAGKLDHWDEIRMTTRYRSRSAQRLGTGVMFQLWSNTIGPGRQNLVRQQVRHHQALHL
jgi:hypothetical protein